MTVHKLSAGDGYTYLTRQVASHDVCRERGEELAGYYTASGNPPGRWVGSGAAELGVAGVVSEAQMKALFGAGLHPDAERIVADLLAAGADLDQVGAAVRLGRRYPRFGQLPSYPERVAARLRELEHDLGRAPTAGEVARVEGEEAARTPRRPVAGYDLVFTPVKSVSLLWALGDEPVRAQVEAAHHAAVADVIGFLERHAAFTRTGAVGQEQVDTRGLVCAAFDHRDSRLGDPDRHTHVAVANKVRAVADTREGWARWLALDARALYAVGVAASERYNTRIEDQLATRLGVRFTERAGSGRDKRPIREITGIPVELIRHFSRRRALVEARYAQLAREYRMAHGCEPPRGAQFALAQQATLDTRDGKKPPRRLDQQLAGWRAEAATVLDDTTVAGLASAVTGGRVEPVTVEQVEVDAAARNVLGVVSAQGDLDPLERRGRGRAANPPAATGQPRAA